MDIIDQLKRDEGFRADVYIDTVGKRTIGYGHNLDARPLPFVSMSEALAIRTLVADVSDTKTKLQAALPWIVDLDDARLGVLINMSFNMGVPGLLAFKRMLAAIQAKDYNAAVFEMKNSKWYLQVGARASRLARQMVSGIWQ